MATKTTTTVTCDLCGEEVDCHYYVLERIKVSPDCAAPEAKYLKPADICADCRSKLAAVIRTSRCVV